MGTLVRLLVEADESSSRAAAKALRAAEEFLHSFDRELTRFDAGSGLARLNADSEWTVRVSELLLCGVEAGIEAAERGRGVIDPTLIGALERAGYDAPRHDVPAESLREAVRLAPPRRAARPDPDSRWQEISVDRVRGTVSRPPGVRIDLGGVGKGLAADLTARLLAEFPRYAVDCGGDLRLGGELGAVGPHRVGWENPFDGGVVAIVEIESGGLATSGIDVRLWRAGDGSYRHHLLDPSTGQPAWTGVVAATAVAATTLEAETLSKLALLLGPAAGRAILAEQGGLLVLDNGDVETLGPLGVSWL